MPAANRLTSIALVPVLMLGAAGCGSVVFDESIDGQEIVRDVGDRFTISLPLTVGESRIARLSPEIIGNAVRLIQREPNVVQRDVFRFAAIAPGEAEIRWWRQEGGERRLAPDCSVNVKVRLAEW